MAVDQAKEDEIVEEIDGQSSHIQLSQDADFCYSATAERDGFNDDYDDEYGDAVETSLRQLKDEFGETFKEKKKDASSLDTVEVVGGKPPTSTKPPAASKEETKSSTSALSH